MNSTQPDLSIIIPVLNEQQYLPGLLDQLARQQAITLQIIIVDGGSRDDSMRICRDFANTHDCLCLTSPPNRATQMNHGAGQARAPLLLFLHADSILKDECLLQNALRHFRDYVKKSEHNYVAGHFSLQFSDTQGLYPKGFYFYAAKTSLNRADTINGDQGLLISRNFFNHVGHFDDRLHYMEDARISQQIFTLGEWITLPGVIYSSARRFITEGLTERQILNSFLCNFNHLGLDTFFSRAGSAYRSQAHTRRLRLRPFLVIVHQLMHEDGLLRALGLWYGTGGYIAANAWQLAFSLDCNRHRANGDPPVRVSPIRLTFFDRYLAWFFQLSLVKAITAFLTIMWFYSLWLKHR